MLPLTRLMNKRIKKDWNLQSELIIATSFLLFSFAVLAAYQGVLFSSTNSLFNTNLTVVTIAAFPLFCILRLILIYKIKLTKHFAITTGTIDILLLSSLIYIFSQQYGTAAATLKSPSFAFYFVFIALHAMRFKPILTLFNGLLSVSAWAIITTALSKDSSTITHNYLEYVTSNSILIGAQVEKIFEPPQKQNIRIDIKYYFLL